MTPSKAPLPILGTWKMTKCETSRPDLPHPASGITTFTQQPDGLHYNAETVWSDGRATKASAVIQMDGTWNAVTGSMLADSLHFERLADGSFEGRMRKGGVDVGTNRTTISADGRIMTGRWELAGPGGATVSWQTTSERQ